MKFKTFLIAGLLLAFTSTISAQSYETGIGAKLGFYNGVSVKHFISPNNALEGVVSFRWGGAIITGLYEWQQPIYSAPGIDYFVGAGAHVGFFDKHKYKHDEASSVFGIDVIVGIEYTLPTVPFTIGIEYKPAFNFVGDTHIWGDGLGVSLRFNIN
jgi:hypothetical protein